MAEGGRNSFRPPDPGEPPKVVPLDGPKKPKLEPLDVIDPARWHDKPLPERDWLIPGLVVRGTVAMVSGDGGTGKSLLLQQLATAGALAEPWIGIEVPPFRTLYVGCEDDEDELQRRQADINRLYGSDMLTVGEQVRFLDRVSKDNILMEFDRRTERGKTTPFYSQINELVQDFEADLVVVDTAADTFGGNENSRPQVRAFVSALRALIRPRKGAAILTSHPSNTGLSTGSGMSGSTGWNNSVRSRSYFTHDDEEGEDGDTRTLKLMKSNYGPKGAKVRVRWEHGCFVPTEPLVQPGGMVHRIQVDTTVKDAIRYIVKVGSKIAADPFARTSLWNRIRGLPSCRSLKKHEIEGTQERLLESGWLVKFEEGPPSKRYTYIVPKDMAPKSAGGLL